MSEAIEKTAMARNKIVVMAKLLRPEKENYITLKEIL
jgi:hypothetical protein